MYVKKKKMLFSIIGFLMWGTLLNCFASDQNDFLGNIVVFPSKFPQNPVIDTELLARIQKQAVRTLSKDFVGLHRSTYCQEEFTVFLEARNQILEQISKLGVYTITLQTDPILKKTDPKIATYHYEIQNISKENIGQFWLTILEVESDKDKKIPKLSEAQKRQWTSYNARLKSMISDEPTTLRGALTPFEALASLGRMAVSQKDFRQSEEVKEVPTSTVPTPVINIKDRSAADEATKKASSPKRIKKDSSDSKKEEKKDKKSNLASSPKGDSLESRRSRGTPSTSPTKPSLLGFNVAELKGKLASKTPKHSVHDDLGIHLEREDFQTRGRSFSFAAPSNTSISSSNSRSATPLNGRSLNTRDRAGSIDESSTTIVNPNSSSPNKKQSKFPFKKKESKNKSSDEKKSKARANSSSSSSYSDDK